MNILITSAGWKSALTCMRSLAKRGHAVSLISSRLDIPHLYSKFCKEKIISPDEANKEEYLKFIKQLIKGRKYDLLVPISDSCVEYFSESREELMPYVQIILPSKEAVNIATSKVNTYRFCEKNGIPIPKTYFPNSIKEIENISELVNFPCIAKRSKGSGGYANTYVNNKESLVLVFKNIQKENEKLFAVQELVKGKFCGFTAICNKGQILSFFMFEVIRQYPKRKGGVTVYARSYYNEQAFNESKKIIQKLSWTGPIDLDFFMVHNKDFILIEINPRFSGTTQFAYSCGIDLPYKYLELISGVVSLPESQMYKIGFYYRAIFPEGILACKENKKYIPSFLLSFLKPNNYYDFSLTDGSLLFRQLKMAKDIIFK